MVLVLVLTNQTSLAKLPANSLPEYQVLRALAALAVSEATAKVSSSVQLVQMAGATVRVASPRRLVLALTALSMSRSLFNRFGSSWIGIYYQQSTYWRLMHHLQPPNGQFTP